jgi:hypothetical protein
MHYHSIMCSSAWSTGDVLDDVAALVAEGNRIDAALARSVRAAELSQAPERDGQKSMASWLRGHGRLSGAEASRMVAAGRRWSTCPPWPRRPRPGWCRRCRWPRPPGR